MKLIHIILLSTISIMTSCSSQSKFDLAKVKLPFNFDQLQNKGFKIEKDKMKFENLTIYDSEDKNLFVFDKVTFIEEFSDKYYSPTRLYFYTDESSKSVQFVRLNTYDDINGKKNVPKYFETIRKTKVL